jgi:hypothetical protein
MIARAHFTPQHLLLCNMGLYKLEFEFEFSKKRSMKHEYSPYLALAT